LELSVETGHAISNLLTRASNTKCMADPGEMDGWNGSQTFEKTECAAANRKQKKKNTHARSQSTHLVR
jgi:hypothetical protein